MMVEVPPLLELHGVAVRYGGVRALDGVDIALHDREIVALVGPNGAGKSTILKSVFGLARIAAGEVRWRGARLHPVAHRGVRLGIAYVPQGRRVLRRLTVEQNLEVGGYTIRRRRDVRRRIDGVMATFPLLRERRRAKAGTLSGGQQQLLAIARALMTEPKALLLDEPSLGLAPKTIKEVFGHIRGINEQHGTAIMVVEHNMVSLLEIAQRAYLLDKGKVVAVDSAERLMSSDILERVFMGTHVPDETVAQAAADLYASPVSRKLDTGQNPDGGAGGERGRTDTDGRLL
jgi:branched-chain amino acid transport system ATP-binding protein